MGLLDDAIREHLELKRRRGADPSEIDRAEREALGPVRRHPEPLEPQSFDESPAAVEDHPYAYADEPDVAGPYAHEDVAEPPVPRAREPLDERAGGLSTPLPAEDHWEDERRPAPFPAGPAGDETAEYALPSEPAEGQEADDMLEETPDFLQDTPDHDRLWFEQRPPRDFDFDS